MILLCTDALDLDISTTSVPMMATPQRRININTAANMANYAKSLPIEIANSPLTSGRSYMPTQSEEDVSFYRKFECVCNVYNVFCLIP